MKACRCTTKAGFAFVTVLLILVAGCTSMALKSSDAAKRMQAVAEVKNQSNLLEIALDREYKNDVRLAALKKLTNQRNFWRVWCANGDNRELADKALELLTDESLLTRVALLHSYEESAEEQEERESNEKMKGMAIGAAALAVNAGGAVAGSKAKGAGGAVAAQAGTRAANAGLAIAISEQKDPEPNMAIRTNEAIVAVGKMKTVAAVSNVAALSTIECVQLPAFRRFLHTTDSTNVLKYVAINGRMEGNSRCWYSNDIETKKNKVIAIAQLVDPNILTEVIKAQERDSSYYAFARLIQLKAFGHATEMLCAYHVHRFLPSVGYGEDVSDANAAKLVARFPEERNCIKLALGSESSAVARAAADRITDEPALLSIARKTSVFSVFKSAISRVSDERSYEDIVLAGGNKSEYAIGLLKDTDYVLELFGKAEREDVRVAIAKRIAEKDITADLCENEKAKRVKVALLERASVEVKAELARRRAEKIKKAVAIAEKDGEELLDLVATKKSDQIDVKKVASIFKGRLLLFKHADMINNDITRDNGRKGCLLHAEKPSKDTWKVNTPLSIEVLFEYGSHGVKEIFSFGNKTVAGGIVRGGSHFFVEIEGEIAPASESLSMEKITHIFDLYDPDDVILDSMLAESDKSPTALYAESAGWELPTASQSVVGTIKDVAQAVGEVKKAVDEFKAAKEKVGEAVDAVKKESSTAWSGVKNVIKDGMKDALGNGKSEPKKALEGDLDLDALLKDLDK